MRGAFELDTKKQRHRQTKTWSNPSLRPWIEEEEPNSCVKHLGSHFKHGRCHNNKTGCITCHHDICSIPVIAVFPSCFLCICIIEQLCTSFFTVSKMQLQHQKWWCQGAHLSVLAAVTTERLTSSTLNRGVGVREHQGSKIKLNKQTIKALCFIRFVRATLR